MMTANVETEWQLSKSGILEAAPDCCAFKRVALTYAGQESSSRWTREVQLAVKEKKAAKAAFKKRLENKEPSTCCDMSRHARRQPLQWQKPRLILGKSSVRPHGKQSILADHPPTPR
ncbi:unnamed protein product [Soboliphyme baturini]|uniref:Uncharacterized protein n=1 Tax=Soboliphyme baturini TaxID=241478 RepID=A0A183J054_9BILA|nr:unnamed protein product [Soboliphyme baturini]